MSLANNIRNRRLKKRLTQMALAERSGVTQAQISRLESGSEENTTLQSLRGIARALGCSVVDLLPEEDKRRQSAAIPSPPRASKRPASSQPKTDSPDPASSLPGHPSGD